MFIIASDYANKVNNVFLFIVCISVILLGIITFLMIYFVIKYDKKRNPVATNIEGNTVLEIIWTIIPTILVLAMFYYGFVVFKEARSAPKDSLVIKVTAQMWSWSYEYDNGKKSQVLYVPLNKPVKLMLYSLDVIHSFFIPAFKIKEDVLPSKLNYLWFQPNKIGSYNVFCAEYCGLNHSHMLSKIIVISLKDFNDWYAGKKNFAKQENKGLQLLKEKGCFSCHTTDGSILVGPSFLGIFGTKTLVLTNGKEREIVVDETYIKKSLEDPGADVVKGFQPIMPSQKGLLNEKEISEIIKFIKELKKTP